VQKVTITNNIIKKALLTILPCVVLTTTFASARQRNVIFFNGMNSKILEAYSDMWRLEELFSEKYPYVEDNLIWHLAYTKTKGLGKDARNMVSLTDDLLYYERHKMSYCWMNHHAYGCNEGTINVQQYKDVKLRVLYDGYPYTSGHFEHNDDIIIAYSRGNIFANMMQTYARGRSVKRINIASPGIERYGYLYNLKNDLVIGALGARPTIWANYYMILSRREKKNYNDCSKNNLIPCSTVLKKNSDYLNDFKGHSFRGAYLYDERSRSVIVNAINNAYYGFNNVLTSYDSQCKITSRTTQDSIENYNNLMETLSNFGIR